MSKTKYIAEKFVSPSPEAEQMGYNFSGFFECVRAEDIDPILQKHGLSVSTFDPTQWYPMQTILDIMKDIYDSDENVSEKLVAMSIKAAQIWPFPPEAKTLPEILMAANKMNSQMQRNVPEGFGGSIRVLGEKHIQMFFNMPHPDESAYGGLWGIVNRYKPAHDVFVVRIIDNPDPENHPGTCIDIKWGPTPADVE
jgi:hypothetical protein